MSLPTLGEAFELLLHHIREAQSAAATLSHLNGLNDNQILAKSWIAVSESLGVSAKIVTQIAMRRRQ